MAKSIDKHFKSRFSGVPYFLLKYEELEEVKVGNNLVVLVQGMNNEFTAFFEGRELNKNSQIVYLQLDYKIEEGPMKERGTKVIKYKLPLTGKIYLEDFAKGKIREYPVE